MTEERVPIHTNPIFCYTRYRHIKNKSIVKGNTTPAKEYPENNQGKRLEDISGDNSCFPR